MKPSWALWRANQSKMIDEVLVERRKQIYLRLVFTIAYGIGYAILGSPAWAVVWFFLYATLQALEHVFTKPGPSKSVPITLGLLFASSAVFGLPAIVAPIAAGHEGTAFRIFLLLGAVVNVVITSGRSLAAVSFSGIPYVVYLQILPLEAYLDGMKPREVAPLAVASALIVVFSSLVWARYAKNLTACVVALEKAETADAAKSAFLATVSHEVRTPLNGMIGMLSVLERTETDHDRLEMLRIVSGSAQNLNLLVSDVLDLEKIAAGRVELNDSPLRPGDVARDVFRLFHPAAQQKGLSFVFDQDEASTLAVVSDRHRLTQIINNLCSNAIKFTTRGEVKLSVRAEPLGSSCKVEFTVSDSGIGISPAGQERLFSPFAQGDRSIGSRFGGTGLGLSICRSLAELMGGRITFRSQEDVGSTFTATFDLPLVGEATEAPALASPIAQTSAAKGQPALEAPQRILVADDHPVNRQVVRAILADHAVLVDAVDGENAVKLARESRFDLILMDMQMPVMDGLQATRAIRDEESASHARRVPLLMLTANDGPEDIRLSLDAGADALVSKPVTAGALLDAIAHALA